MKADFVTENIAKDVATNYLIISGKAPSNMVLTLVHTNYVANDVLSYVFDINNTAHIIIAADDRLTPIRAYVEEAYIFNNDNPNLLYWNDLQEYYFIDSVITNLTSRKLDEWSFYLDASNQNLSVVMAIEGPLLTSGWGQGSCYNDVVETNTATGVVVGCVATALGQIMNYYQHPYQGEGATTLTTPDMPLCNNPPTNPSYYPLVVNHSTTQHNWSNISTGNCSSSNPSATVSACSSGDGTSQLLYEIGVCAKFLGMIFSKADL